jgi:hypothetical protein
MTLLQFGSPSAVQAPNLRSKRNNSCEEGYTKLAVTHAREVTVAASAVAQRPEQPTI